MVTRNATSLLATQTASSCLGACGRNAPKRAKAAPKREPENATDRLALVNRALVKRSALKIAALELARKVREIFSHSIFVSEFHVYFLICRFSFSVSCPKLPEFLHATRDGDSLRIGSVVTYTANDHYQFGPGITVLTITCTSYADWDPYEPTEPQCKEFYPVVLCI